MGALRLPRREDKNTRTNPFDRQIDQMFATQAIEVASATSLDLRVTLNTIILQAGNFLHADATEILLVNQDGMTMTHAVGQGFRSRLAENAKVRMGEGLAGLTAMRTASVRGGFQPNTRE